MAEPDIWARAMRSGLGTNTSHKAVAPPIRLSANYVFAAPGESGGYGYSRAGNPTRDLLLDTLAIFEGSAAATVVATGLAAATLLVEELVPIDGVVVYQHDCYGGTWRLLNHHTTRDRLGTHSVGLNDPEVLKASLDDVSMVLAETPPNPLLRVTNPRAIAETTHVVGTQLVADNTSCSLLLQRPIDLGANYMLHLTTKFISGYSDVVGRTVVIRDPGTAEYVGWLANVFGLTTDAFDSYPTLWGLWTLDTRTRMHAISTGAVVDTAQGHPVIAILH